MITATSGISAVNTCVAVMPSMSGMLTSISNTSGAASGAFSMHSAPLPAVSTISISDSNRATWPCSRGLRRVVHDHYPDFVVHPCSLITAYSAANSAVFCSGVPTLIRT